MNNKGFAITAILYGTLILFLMLLLSMLGILSTYKDRLSMLIDSNNGARDIINTFYGDVNLDGVVDEDDIVLIQDYVDGDATLSKTGLNNADVNLDGIVDEDDVSDIELYVSMPDLYPLPSDS